jgi:NADH:ubiquinone oxidoreductase subunit 2 (subunit N)
MELDQYKSLINISSGLDTAPLSFYEGPEGPAGLNVSTLANVVYIAQGLYGVDTTIVGIKLAILVGSMSVLLLSISYYAASPLRGVTTTSHPTGREQEGVKKHKNLLNYEYTLLILLSTLGMLLLVSSKDLISLYLAIELISLSLYILAGIKRDGQYSTEASIKYFLLGAVSSGLLLFGSALMY